MNKISCAFYTLGCKVNQYDTEQLKRRFIDNGYSIVDFLDKADIYIINTCTVTQAADHKSRQAIRKARRRNAEALIIVTGCYAQINPEELRNIPGVSYVIGIQEKEKIFPYVERNMERLTLKPKGTLENSCLSPCDFQPFRRARALVKIQDGCDHFCSYCIVPYARGRPRSRPVQEIISEIRTLESCGFKEIVLCGVRLGAYGKDFQEEKADLVSLLTAILSATKIPRIRLSSIDPSDVSGQLIDLIASSDRICPHLHLPLQSADDEILKLMNRDYTSRDYARLVREARSKIPQIAITTDIMVGFPGEGERHFINTYNFVKEVKFAKAHIFKYSDRPGTKACQLADKIAPEIKAQRSQKLMELTRRQASDFREQFINTEKEVLVESKDKKGGLLQGLTDNYLKVFFPGPENLIGQVAKVRITAAFPEHLIGIAST